MNPAGGVAGLVAIHDAVALANWLSTLHSPTLRDMDKVFKKYRDERYPVAKQAFQSSQMYTKFLGKVKNFLDVVDWFDVFFFFSKKHNLELTSAFGYYSW